MLINNFSSYLLQGFFPESLLRPHFSLWEWWYVGFCTEPVSLRVSCSGSNLWKLVNDFFELLQKEENWLSYHNIVYISFLHKLSINNLIKTSLNPCLLSFTRLLINLNDWTVTLPGTEIGGFQNSISASWWTTPCLYDCVLYLLLLTSLFIWKRKI